LMLLVTILNFCIAGPVSIGLAYLSKTRFGSPAEYGIAISAVAAGSLLGALLAGVWKIRQRGMMILLVSLALGVCLGSIGLLGKVWSIASVLDRKSTRLNSSHVAISYAVFCLKK